MGGAEPLQHRLRDDRVASSEAAASPLLSSGETCSTCLGISRTHQRRQLLIAVREALPQADKHDLVAEFERGRSHILFGITLKIGVFLEQPWSLRSRLVEAVTASMAEHVAELSARSALESQPLTVTMAQPASSKAAVVRSLVKS